MVVFFAVRNSPLGVRLQSPLEADVTAYHEHSNLSSEIRGDKSLCFTG